MLEGARQALFERRAMRPRPHLDDKILTAWNGLTIGAFARVAHGPRSGRFPGRRRPGCPVRSAESLESMATLLRRYRQGDAKVDGYAEDYAYLVFGLLELFQAGGDPEWLRWALQLQGGRTRCSGMKLMGAGSAQPGATLGSAAAERGLRRRRAGGQFGVRPESAHARAPVFLCPPEGGHYEGEQRFDGKIRQTFGGFASRAGQMGRSIPMMLAALSTYHAGMPQIVLLPSRTPTTRRRCKPCLQGLYLPTAIVVPVFPQHRETLSRLLPWVSSMRMVEGRATAYVCRDFTCQSPTTSPEELAAQLST